jgi:hypothetical protein
MVSAIGQRANEAGYFVDSTSPSSLVPNFSVNFL